MAAEDVLFEYLLRLGDNCLILGHRLSEWVGHGPAHRGGARARECRARSDRSDAALARLCRRGRGEGPRRGQARLSPRRPRVPQPAARRAAERRFRDDDGATVLFRRLASRWSCAGWRVRTTDGLPKSPRRPSRKSRITLPQPRLGDPARATGPRKATDACKPASTICGPTPESCSKPDDIDREIAALGAGPDLAALHGPWLELIRATAEEAKLTLPQPGWMQRGGKCGVHTEHLGYVLAELQFLQRAYPNATW